MAKADWVGEATSVSMAKADWVGEATSFTFRDERTKDNGPVLLVVEVVETVWSVPESLRALCLAIAHARGHVDDRVELRRALGGEYDWLRRQLDRATIHVEADDFDPETVSVRLDRVVYDSTNEFGRAAYVLDAALDRWGYFIGNFTFERPLDGGTLHFLVPETEEQFERALAPWLEQLTTPEGREAFNAAVEAARALDGAACRAACEHAAATLPKVVAEVADTERPEET